MRKFAQLPEAISLQARLSRKGFSAHPLFDKNLFQHCVVGKQRGMNKRCQVL